MVLYNLHVILGCLYLRGAPRRVDLPRRAWPQLEALLRGAAPELERAPMLLKEAGYWQEAAALSEPGLLGWGEHHASHFLTPVSLAYPVRWHLLGASAPPAVWITGDSVSGPLLGVTGCRAASESSLTFAQDVAREAVQLGYSLISGGAIGCDAAALRGALCAGGSGICLLPHGLNHIPDCSSTLFASVRSLTVGGTMYLSLCALDEPFSTGNAMARNALIFSGAVGTVVASARLRQGGSWHGAADALRRHLGPVYVREAAPTSRYPHDLPLGRRVGRSGMEEEGLIAGAADRNGGLPANSPEGVALRALIALGASPLPSPCALGPALAKGDPFTRLQPALFGAVPA